MNIRTQPVIGQWYLHCGENTLLEVFNVDLDEGTVDIQDEAGNVCEWALAEWYGTELEPNPPPLDAYQELEASYDGDADTDEIMDPAIVDTVMHGEHIA